MSLQILVDNKQVNYEKITFSDGASNVKVDPIYEKPNRVVIGVNVTSNMDDVFWEIILVCCAIEEMIEGFNDTQLTLFLPYLPHGRADRIFEFGNSKPLSAFIHFCVSNFDVVTVIDPHSDYLKKTCDESLLRTEYGEIRQWACFAGQVPIEKDEKVVIVSPDKGAVPKAEETVNYYQQKGYDVNIVFADKIRDLSTGQIQSINVKIDPWIDIENSRFIIADDICDGGGTFLGLSKELREKGAKQVELYVTHGIFSKGLKIFKGFIDKIHCYQTISTYVKQGDIIDFNEGKETK